MSGEEFDEVFHPEQLVSSHLCSQGLRQIRIHLVILVHDLAEILDLRPPVRVLVVEDCQVISDITVLDPVEVVGVYIGDRLGVEAVVGSCVCHLEHVGHAFDVDDVAGLYVVFPQRILRHLPDVRGVVRQAEGIPVQDGDRQGGIFAALPAAGQGGLGASLPEVDADGIAPDHEVAYEACCDGKPGERQVYRVVEDPHLALREGELREGVVLRGKIGDRVLHGLDDVFSHPHRYSNI